jgi:hypothetical protein
VATVCDRGRKAKSLHNARSSTVLLGAIAQLAERLLCKQEVGSSNLPGSTSFRRSEMVQSRSKTIWTILFRGQFALFAGIAVTQFTDRQRLVDH